MEKILSSKAIIRFQDCDPFNHLNNASYLNYLNNAREDQLIKYYGIDIYEMAKTKGKSWVTGSNQIAYIRPAFLMEEVTIETQMLSYDDYSIKVEMRMWNLDKTKIKAIMWSNYVYFNLLTQKKEPHSEKLMNLYKSVVKPVESAYFEDRMKAFKSQMV
jgi:acyl-CoA thioester hydrolase